MMYEGDPKWIKNDCGRLWPYVKLSGFKNGPANLNESECGHKFLSSGRVSF